MSVIPAANLLNAWERGGSASPGERGLLLLAVAEPDVPAKELAAWSVGRRDAALLALRERAFGPRLTGLASCPRCSEPLEVQFAVSDIVVPVRLDAPARLSLAGEAYRVAFRLPSAGDMATLAQANGGQVSDRWLLERCIVEAWRAEAPVAPTDLPDGVLEAVTAAMAEADPQAEVALSLRCSVCGSQWQALFDIVSFLWREIDAWAERILREVHTLASVYGWRERDILTLSSWRRRYYIRLISG
jgi:hypothetical protein